MLRRFLFSVLRCLIIANASYFDAIPESLKATNEKPGRTNLHCHGNGDQFYFMATENNFILPTLEELKT